LNLKVSNSIADLEPLFCQGGVGMKMECQAGKVGFFRVHFEPAAAGISPFARRPARSRRFPEKFHDLITINPFRL
jgi:hypothetical protein